MELDDDELEHTRELHTGEIRKKDLMSCNEKELRIRCSFDERYIAVLERKIKELSNKVEQHRRSYETSRDCYEESE